MRNGMLGQLGKYVRAKKGLAYSVYGVFQPNREAGSFGGGVDTAIESTADAVQAMFDVFEKMRGENVTDQELAEAKMRVAGGMVMVVTSVLVAPAARLETMREPSSTSLPSSVTSAER